MVSISSSRSEIKAANQSQLSLINSTLTEITSQKINRIKEITTTDDNVEELTTELNNLN